MLNIGSHRSLRPLIALSIILSSVAGYGQNCPVNIDFESGSFDGWKCYTGSANASAGQNYLNLIESGPMFNRHTLIQGNSSDLDPYGQFPISCPNGSGYSVRLGNDEGGGQAEGIAYEFTIPANQNIYSLIYHYAVVFQDPNHQQPEQPRMETEIINVTDNKRIDCSSFTFFPYGSPLPGFQQSQVSPDGNSPVWYKNWSAVSINLNGNAGKKIRLFFKTGDCTFRRHFGYAYIDVNSECSSEFVGATYCNDDTTVTLTAPYGYQSYTWFNSSLTQVLGTAQTLSFSPPPPVGTTVAVAVVPYNGYGCLDTLYAKLIDTLKLRSNAGSDQLSCNGNAVQLGAIPKPGLVYSWSPATGLSNPGISNPSAIPLQTTSYILTTRNSGGGCKTADTVIVRSSIVDSSLQVLGKLSYCITSGDSAVFLLNTTDNIQWYRNSIVLNGATQPRYRATQSGSYQAVITNLMGCSIQSVPREVLIDIPKRGITYPLQYAVIDLPLGLKARPIGASVLWSPARNLSSAASFTPVFRGSADQQYLITITAASGCVTVDTQMVKTVKAVEIYVPTAFTPNNDGLNDYLRPICMGIVQFRSFKIFNRWGELIYQSGNETPGWNGIVNGKPQASQVVVWMAEGTGVDGRLHVRKGTAMLVR